VRELRCGHLEQRRQHAFVRGLDAMRAGHLCDELSLCDRGSQLCRVPERLLHLVVEPVRVRFAGLVCAGHSDHGGRRPERTSDVRDVRSRHLVPG
jgi:hypothetical protein